MDYSVASASALGGLRGSLIVTAAGIGVFALSWLSPTGDERLVVIGSFLSLGTPLQIRRAGGLTCRALSGTMWYGRRTRRARA
jgi:hypothetical protein